MQSPKIVSYMLDNNYNLFKNENAKGKPLKTFILTVGHNITNYCILNTFI